MLGGQGASVVAHDDVFGADRGPATHVLFGNAKCPKAKHERDGRCSNWVCNYQYVNTPCHASIWSSEFWLMQIGSLFTLRP